MTVKTIFKFNLKAGCTRLLMPIGAKVLDVQMQGDDPQLWALVDADRPKELRTFEIYGTGHPIPAGGMEYVATFQIGGGDLVLHVFEVLDQVFEALERK